MQKNMKKYDHHGHPKYCYSFSLARLVLLSNIIIVTPGIVIVTLQVGIVCYPISSSPPQVMLLLFSGLVLQPQVGVCTVDPALLESMLLLFLLLLLLLLLLVLYRLVSAPLTRLCWSW